MTSVKRVVLAAALTITMGGIALSPAKAVMWDFSSPTRKPGPHKYCKRSYGSWICERGAYFHHADRPVRQA